MSAKKTVRTYKKRLEEKRKELTEGLTKNRDEVKNSASSDTIRDYADVAQSAYTKEFLYSLSNEERRMLRLVDGALDRIKNKQYGKCTACGKEVQPKRLEAVPWALHCIQCQELQDRGLLES